MDVCIDMYVCMYQVDMSSKSRKCKKEKHLKSPPPCGYSYSQERLCEKIQRNNPESKFLRKFENVFGDALATTTALKSCVS